MRPEGRRRRTERAAEAVAHCGAQNSMPCASVEHVNPVRQGMLGEHTARHRFNPTTQTPYAPHSIVFVQEYVQDPPCAVPHWPSPPQSRFVAHGCPTGRGRHAPAKQDSPSMHAWPQAPQLVRSFCRSVQTLLHAMMLPSGCPPSHWNSARGLQAIESVDTAPISSARWNCFIVPCFEDQKVPPKVTASE